MAVKRTRGERVFGFFNILFMVALMVVTLYPVLYVLFSSLSLPGELVAHRGILLHPLGFTLGSYRRVFDNPMIGVGYRNTLIIVIGGTSLNVLLTAFAAYGLSRKQVLLRNIIMFGIVFTMMFKGGLIPLYLLVNNLGLLDSRWALVLPTAISAWNLIIMRTYFLSIPDSLEESARMDGANDWIILFRIMLPLAMPVVAVMILFYGVYNWNSWFYAMIFLRNRDLYPLQIILREILIANDTSNMTTGMTNVEDVQDIGETIKYATIIVATIPILLIYPALQKYFIRGVMIGAIKG